MGYVRHEGIQVGAQHWDTDLQWNLIAFAACGTSCGQLMANAVSVCWLWGLAPCFKIHENRVKGSEDKSCKVKLSPTLCLLLFRKKIPQQSFPACVCAGECKAEVGICVTCVLRYFYKNRKTTNYFWHCTNTSSLGSSKYEVN